jgi:hypothetical protein
LLFSPQEADWGQVGSVVGKDFEAGSAAPFAFRLCSGPCCGDQAFQQCRDIATTIRIGIATLPDHLDRSRPNAVAGVIEAALREGGIKADCSDLFSHLKIDLPTAQLAAASVVLVDLRLI